MGGQLGPDGLVVADRVAVERRDVDEVDEHRAALDVGEELVAEAGALGSALDQPGDVGDHRLAVLALDRPQRRRERREGVVGNLWRRPGKAAEQRGLAGVGQPDQADVGEQFQLQLDPVGLAGGAVLGEARRLPGRGGEALVAVPAATAVGDDGALPNLDQVERAAVDRHRLGPGGDRNHGVLPPPPLPVGAFAVAAALGAEVLGPLEGAEIATGGVADEHHVAPVPAVPPVGPAARHVRLTAEADAAVAAGTALNPDFRLVVHAGRG